MIILLTVCILLVGFLVAGISGAPWVPARKVDIDHLFDEVHLKKSDSVVELGCGDGRIVVAVARRGVKVTGYEINPLLYLISALRTLPYRSIAKVKFGSFWNKDISGADLVIAFLIPRTMPRLAIKAKSQMKQGSQLISYIFVLPGLKPVKTDQKWHIYKF